MKTIDLNSMLERPSNALVERCSKKYKNDARYSYADEIQRRLTTKFAGDYESILLAVVFLNQIYSTNLYDVYRVADHIYKKKDMILPAIETGKIEAVEMIATGHGIGRKGCKESVFYSFSTKFCNYLNPKDYPIFDSHVEKMLKAYNRNFGFHTGAQNNLRDYAIFKEWIQSLMTFFDLNCTLWELDKSLWSYGKNSHK